MNAINLRDTSRTKLSPRYGAIHALGADRDRIKFSHMSTAELRSLVAAMID